ncbi:MAG: glycosyltransferase family 2 protein [Pseudomonadales bacterium]
MENIDLSIVIPAFNESLIIEKNIDELFSWLGSNLPDFNSEIIVVNDGSTDKMGDVLEEMKKTRPWLVIAHHKRNFGRGRGVRTGFRNSKGCYVVCMDADLSYEPAIIARLLKPLIAGDADIVLASAHHPEGHFTNVPKQREMLSKWGNNILRLGFQQKMHTVTCIVRAFKREVIGCLELVSDGKELHLEILQKSELMGFHIMEIPATLEWRDKDRRRSTKKGIMPEIAIFKMRKTVLSHLIFNFVTNPGVLLFLPLLSLLGVIVATSIMLIASLIEKVSIEPSLFLALRQAFLDGQLTLAVLLFSAIAFMIFLMFFFLSFQNKRYFDEVYTLMMRMNARIKEMEDRE